MSLRANAKPIVRRPRAAALEPKVLLTVPKFAISECAVHATSEPVEETAVDTESDVPLPEIDVRPWEAVSEQPVSTLNESLSLQNAESASVGSDVKAKSVEIDSSSRHDATSDPAFVAEIATVSNQDASEQESEPPREVAAESTFAVKTLNPVEWFSTDVKRNLGVVGSIAAAIICCTVVARAMKNDHAKDKALAVDTGDTSELVDSELDIDQTRISAIGTDPASSRPGSLNQRAREAFAQSQVQQSVAGQRNGGFGQAVNVQPTPAQFGNQPGYSSTAGLRSNQATPTNFGQQNLRQQNFGQAAATQPPASQSQIQPNQPQSQPNQPQSQPNQLQSQPNQLQSQPNQLQSQPNQLQSQANQLQSQPNQLQSQPNQLQSQPNQLQPAQFSRTQPAQFQPSGQPALPTVGQPFQQGGQQAAPRTVPANQSSVFGGAPSTNQSQVAPQPFGSRNQSPQTQAGQPMRSQSSLSPGGTPTPNEEKINPFDLPAFAGGSERAVQTGGGNFGAATGTQQPTATNSIAQGANNGATFQTNNPNSGQSTAQQQLTNQQFRPQTNTQQYQPFQQQGNPPTRNQLQGYSGEFVQPGAARQPSTFQQPVTPQSGTGSQSELAPTGKPQGIQSNRNNAPTLQINAPLLGRSTSPALPSANSPNSGGGYPSTGGASFSQLAAEIQARDQRAVPVGNEPMERMATRNDLRSISNENLNSGVFR